jgi:hypothetical protein
MLSAALLDAVTTWFTLSHRLGVESNHLAAVLFRHSTFWIPVFLLILPSLVPFLPEIPRRTLAIFFLTLQLLAGLNNLGGILFHHYMIAEYLGRSLVYGVSLSLSAWFFLSALARPTLSPQARWRQILILVGSLATFSLIHGFFFLLKYLWSAK